MVMIYPFSVVYLPICVIIYYNFNPTAIKHSLRVDVIHSVPARLLIVMIVIL